MAPASAPRISKAGAACLYIAPNTSKARGILGAAEYIANSNDACVGTDSTGTRYCGRMIATMEKPLATRTSIAVTTEASIIVVIDSSTFCLLACVAPAELDADFVQARFQCAVEFVVRGGQGVGQLLDAACAKNDRSNGRIRQYPSD